MPLSRVKYVNLLRSKTGYHEGRNADGSWNNHQMFSPATAGLEWSQNQAWCHTFVSWGADELGGRDIIPITASCYQGVQWWKARDRFTPYPVLGAPFYMGTSGQDHVGVVYGFDADSIWTVEGNTSSGGSFQGDGVYQRVRPRRGAGSPYGYGIPDFSDGLICAGGAGGVERAFVPADEQPSTPARPARPRVSVSHIERARQVDPGAAQGHRTYPADVNVVEAALVRGGFLANNRYAFDGSFGSKTVAAYDAFRRSAGYRGLAATGSIGRESLSKLGAKYGFDVIN